MQRRACRTGPSQQSQSDPSRIAAQVSLCKPVAPNTSLQYLRKPLGIRHRPLLERMPSCITHRGGGHEGGEHGQPERSDEQQRELLRRPCKDIHSVGGVAPLRKPRHGLGAAETDDGPGKCQRMKDGIDRQQIANDKSPHQSHGADRESVPSDNTPKDRQHGARQEVRAQSDEIETVQRTEVEPADQGRGTPDHAQEKSAHNDTDAAPSGAKDEDQRKHGIEPKLVRQGPERLIDRGARRIREYAGDDLCHAAHKQQEIVDYIGDVRPEIIVFAVPEKSHRRRHDERKRKVRKYSQDPRAHETNPAG
jgi:hypothetical protein